MEGASLTSFSPSVLIRSHVHEQGEGDTNEAGLQPLHSLSRPAHTERSLARTTKVFYSRVVHSRPDGNCILRALTCQFLKLRMIKSLNTTISFLYFQPICSFITTVISLLHLNLNLHMLTQPTTAVHTNASFSLLHFIFANIIVFFFSFFLCSRTSQISSSLFLVYVCGATYRPGIYTAAFFFAVLCGQTHFLVSAQGRLKKKKEIDCFHLRVEEP